MLRLRTLRRAIALPLLTVALALLSVWHGGGAPRAGAHAGTHPDMFFSMDTRGGAGTCSSGSGPPYDHCAAPAGDVFTMEFVMQTSDVQYRYVQFAVQYSGLTSKDNPQFFPPVGECDSTNAIPSPGQLIFSCSVNQYAGAVAVADLDFNCTNAPSVNNEIKFFVGLGDSESHMRDESGVRHTDGTYERSMFVDCIVPQHADMHLEIKSGDATCHSLPNASSCTVPPGGTFVLGIATNAPPPQGYYQFVTEVLYGGLKYNPAPDNPFTSDNEGVAYEVVWPAGGYDLYGVRFPYPPNGTEGYIQHGVAGPDSHYVGNLVDLSMSCLQPGTFPVTLTSFDYPERSHGSEFFAVRSGANDYNAVRLNSEDTINVTCLAPPTSTPTITPTATPMRTRVPPALGGVAERPDLRSGGFGVWASVAAALGAFALAAGGVAMRRRGS